MDKSYKPELQDLGDVFLKTYGRKLYQYALENVPQAIKDSLDKANGKMDDAIIERLHKLYRLNEVPQYALPMIISWLGNTSVATIPTLLDLILQKG